MSVNLVNLIKGQLGDSLLEQLGGVLGESAENTRNAVDASVPTIIGSIADKVANDSNASDMLSNALDGLDSSTAVDFAGMLGSDNRDSIAEKGAGLLEGLFADKLGGITDLISQFSGIGGKSSSSLLSMILPMVLGAINKQKTVNGLDHAGVLSMLGDQKDYVSQAMPSGMGDLLNSSGLFSGLSGMLAGATGAVGDAVSGAADAAADAAAGAADSAKDAASTAADAVSGAADAAADVAGSAKDAVSDAASSAAGAVGDAVSGAADAAADVAGSAKDAAANAASGVADTTSQAASAGGSMIRKILPIAVAVLLVLFILKSCM